MHVVAGDGPEEWVEIRIRAVSVPTHRYRRSSIFDITVRLDQDSRFTLQSVLKPGSDFRRDYRDIRVERRTVRTVATDWEPVTGDELPA